MRLYELQKVLAGNENMTISARGEEHALFSGTTQNIPHKYLTAKVQKVFIDARVYLGITVWLDKFSIVGFESNNNKEVTR